MAYIVILLDQKIAKNCGHDAGIAAMSISMVAYDAGVGSCMLGAVDRERLGKILKIGDNHQILLAIALGYPAEEPVAEKMKEGDQKYWLDQQGVLHVPKRAFEEIVTNARMHNPSADIRGVLVEKMARGGVEVILGATRDPKFGPICMFGLGGTFVQAVRDVTFRLAPMWEISAERMIRSINSYKILKGMRGIPPSDIDAIKDCILRLSQMVSDHPEIAELDINPLIVYPEGKGCVVADSRILLAAPAPERVSDVPELSSVG